MLLFYMNNSSKENNGGRNQEIRNEENESGARYFHWATAEEIHQATGITPEQLAKFETDGSLRSSETEQCHEESLEKLYFLDVIVSKVCRLMGTAFCCLDCEKKFRQEREKAIDLRREKAREAA